MEEVMRYESNKWLWIANAILVRTGSSQGNCRGFAPRYKLFSLLILGILRVSGVADKENS